MVWGDLVPERLVHDRMLVHGSTVPDAPINRDPAQSMSAGYCGRGLGCLPDLLGEGVVAEQEGALVGDKGDPAVG